MRPSLGTFRALSLLVLLGCGSFLDPEDYEQLPPFENLDFATVTPSSSFLLWELRTGSEGGGPHSVLARGGSADPSAIPADLLAAFNATRASSGFDPTCLPGYCYKYFVSLEGTTIRIWDSVEEAREFIGSVTNRVEAAIIVKANGFYWMPPGETAGIRQVTSGFELVVLALVEFCDPIRYDRFLVHVATSGALEIRKREVWKREAGYCI